MTITRVEAAPGDAWSGLVMVSIPLVPDVTDPKPITGFLDNSWLTFLPVSNSYAQYPSSYSLLTPRSATPGRGFWAYFDPDEDAAARAYPLGELLPTDQPAVIQLEPGWNLIGCPFATPVTWDTSTIMVRKLNGTTTSLAESAALVRTFVWGWQRSISNPDTGEYVLVADKTLYPTAEGQLEPWQGYWIKAMIACDLIIPAPSAQ